ncbi:hypothetical protein BU15DRAFT_73852 [Melanogaster broomeanus]|nr:hypothetical protein BU15DRAFT_73852 [Melanogaster broomeanus]
MSDPITSPEEHKAAVKVKYSAKAKIPATPSGPKVVTVHLPGPSPKRQRGDSEERQAPLNPISKSTHARGSSTPPTKSNLVKPSPPSGRSSSIKPRSHRRPESPADDADETSSIAESSTGVRPIGSAQGILHAMQQLGKPWETPNIHMMKPAIEESLEVEEPRDQPAPDKGGPDPAQEEEPLHSPTTSVAVTGANDGASSPASSKSTRRSEAERIAVLQADSRAQEVKPARSPLPILPEMDQIVDQFTVCPRQLAIPPTTMRWVYVRSSASPSHSI